MRRPAPEMTIATKICMAVAFSKPVEWLVGWHSRCSQAHFEEIFNGVKPQLKTVAPWGRLPSSSIAWESESSATQSVLNPSGLQSRDQSELSASLLKIGADLALVSLEKHSAKPETRKVLL